MYKVYYLSEALDFESVPFEQGPTQGAVLFDEPLLDTAKMLQNLQNTKHPQIISPEQAEKTDLTTCSLLWLVEAAGGVVRYGQQRLMIVRNGSWDLPKGCLEVGENIEECALREVCEECGIEPLNISPGRLITQTHHAYNLYGRHTLKRTWWYDMQICNIDQLSPQTEEGITAVKWLDDHQIQEALKESFGTIADTITAHNKLINR